MKKEYFFVNPSNFSRIGDINIDGDFGYVQFKDFIVDEPKGNYIFFEVRYEYNENKKAYFPVVKEVITGKKFDLDVNDRKNSSTGKIETTVVLTSEELGLYSKRMCVSDIERKPSNLSGVFCYFENNPDDKEDYCEQLRDMFEEAKAHKQSYDELIYGPSRLLTKQIKRTYKQSR